MKVTTERLEDCQVKINVELDAADIDKKLRQTARQLSRQFTVPGYRRGKAPYHAVIRVFGREAVQQQGLEDFGNDLYEEALEQVEYEPYEVGQLEEVEWDPFVMTILLPIQPEVDLGDYRSVRVPFEVEEITEETVDKALAEMQLQYAQWVPVERPAETGDQVVLDMEGKAGDDLFMSNQEYEMVLDQEAPYPLPGFHEQIVGLSSGEEKTFTLTLPEDDLDESLSDQEGIIEVKLHSVKEQDLPPLDDELAMMVGDYDNLDALRLATQENLGTEAQQKAESEYLENALGAMSKAAVQIEYPSQAIEQEADVTLSQIERNLAASGIELDTYLGMMGKTREVYKLELRPAAEERLKQRLVMANVAAGEGLTVDDETIDAEIERLSIAMGDRADKMREMLNTPPGRLSVADDLMVTKAQERIVQIARGKAPDLEEETEEVEAEEALEAEEEQVAGEAEEESSAKEPAPEEEADKEESLPEEEQDADTEAETAGEQDEENTEETKGNEAD